ncbi:MAG: response regulator [bacterium]|nr:response regulator [bacterium]MCP5064968.1 response regulator [bacterium]
MDETPLALVVDDEPVVQRLVAQIFNRSGIEVHSVSDGSCAIEWIAQIRRPIERALIDATVPPDGALAIVEVLRAQDPKSAIVVTSGKPLEASHQRRLDAIGGVFLPKPFGPQALLDAVEAARRK